MINHLPLIFQLEHVWIPIFAYPEMLSSSLIDCLAMGVQQNYKPSSLENIHAQHTSYSGNSNANERTGCKTVYNNCWNNNCNSVDSLIILSMSHEITIISGQGYHLPIGSQSIMLFYQSAIWSDLKRLLKSKVACLL